MYILPPVDAGYCGPDDGGDPDAYGPVGHSDWLDVDWAEHQRWVRVEDRWVNVVELGAGPPLLLIHGLSCWQSWLENICFFARDHRVIAMDLPGFGASQAPAEAISISGYARMLDALCDELGVACAAVVGNSMGGFIGAELAIRFPARVSRLCLAPAIGLNMEHVRIERRRTIGNRVENLLFFGLAWLSVRSDLPVRRAGLRQKLLSLVVAHPERLPGALVLEVIRATGRATGFAAALDAITKYPIRDRLGEIVCPTLIIWGEDDRLVPVSDATELEWLIPNSRKLIYEETGHLPMLERPTRFNADLHAFLSEAAVVRRRRRA
jgi:pimeloyl-ACP methyl ester carboxylesterase